MNSMKFLLLLLLSCGGLIGFVTSFVSSAYSSAVRNFCSERYAQFFELYPVKFSQKFPLQIGVEIEGSVPRHIGLEGIAKELHKVLLLKYHKAKLEHIPALEEYLVSYRNHIGEEKTYRINIDYSVVTSRAPFEIASPILKEPEDFETFRKLVLILNKIGGKSEPASAGIHIHVDFSNAHLGEITSLAALFSEVEEDLMRQFSTLESRKKYTLPTAEMIRHFLLHAQLTSPLDQSKTLFWTIVSRQSRYHALNLRSYLQYDTVEFRLFNSTLNIKAIELMQDFAMKLVSAIRSKNPALVEYLVQNKGPIQLEELSKILDMKISEPKAKEVLNRILDEAENKNTYPHLKNSFEYLGITQLALLVAASVVISEVIQRVEPILMHSPGEQKDR